MEFKEVLMNSPRHPRVYVRINVPVIFEQYREVDEVARLAVEIMNHRASFATFPLDAIGFIAIKLAITEAADIYEINRGKAMMQAIMAVRVPARQEVISMEALYLLREKDPNFYYPTGARRA